jgi:hypothetical protein
MLKRRIHKRIKRFKSSLGYHLEDCKDVINDTKPVETIQAFVQPPSARANCLRFVIYQDRQVAKTETKRATPAV